MAVQSITVMMRPSDGCNLACKYCYVHKKSPGKMSDETLEELTRSTLQQAKRVKFLWHGDEPLLCGPDFFKRAIELQREYAAVDQVIANQIQTNGTLIDREFARLFRKEGFEVSLSLDGCRDDNDSCRVFPSGRGTFDAIAAGASALRAEKVEFGGILVIGRHNCRNLMSAYESYKEMGASSMKLNPCICPQKRGLEEDPNVIGHSLSKLYDYWIADDQPLTRVSPLHEISVALLGGAMNECSYSGRCSRGFIAFDIQGNAYPCNRFVGQPEFLLGNVSSLKLTSLSETRACRDLAGRAATVGRCGSCSFKHLCNAGCAYSSYSYTGGLDARDHYCQSRYALFEHILHDLEQRFIGRKWNANNGN